MNVRRWGGAAFVFTVAALASPPVSAQPALLPSLTKSFSPTTISPGGVTVLTFTVSNPAGSPALSNVGFTDTLPSGLVVGIGSVGGTCSNAAAATNATAGSSTITTTNLDVPAGSSTCTVTVNVTNASGQFNGSCSGFPAAFTNASGNVSVTNVSNDIQPSCVVVTPPVLTKSFSPTTISPGATTVLTFTVSNPAGNPALSNVSFTDTLPSGLVVGNPGSVGGTCANAAAATTATAGSSTITVQNLQVSAGSATCTMTVNVTNATDQFNGSCSGLPAAFTNASGNVSVTNVSNGIQPSCVVVTPPEVSSQPVPTLSVPMLALLGLAIAAAAIRLMRN